MISITETSYMKTENWNNFFKSGKTIKDIPIHQSWEPIFEKIFSDSRFQKIEKKIKEDVNEGKTVAPKPCVLFNTFFVTPFEEIKVIIIGQDPYFNLRTNNVPEAVGLSFSVPSGFPIPSSLKSIYDNLMKYKNIKFMPKNGNLMFWALQGCIMLNTALSVEIGKKKSHSVIWRWLTDEIIRYISFTSEHVVFLLWGADAYAKSNLIDQDKHDIIVSSHPSGLSRSKPLGKNGASSFKSFDDTDHFSLTNELLIKHNQTPITWQVP